jgi:hypothetical protein
MRAPDDIAPVPRRRGFFRRDAWETIATVVIAAGVVMLMQPFALELYSYSFVTTLAGTVLFTIAGKLPE